MNFLSWGLSGRLAYGYRNMSLGVILLLCPFNRIIVVGFPIGPMTCLFISSWTTSVSGMGFILWSGIKCNQKALDSSIRFMLLLHLWTCLTNTVIVVAYRGNSLARFVSIFFLWQYACHLPALWKVAGSNEASSSALDWYLHVLWLKNL